MNDHRHDGVRTPTATRVYLRPLANPLSLGFLGVFFATMMLTSQQLGWVPASEGHTLDLGILAFTVPVIVIACFYGFLARDTVAATGFGVQAGTWGTVGLVSYLSPPSSHSAALGMILIMGATAVCMPVIGAVNNKVVAGIAMFTTATRWVVTAAYEFDGSALNKHIAGGWGVLLAVVCLYASLAFELEDQQRRTIIPTLRRNGGELAMRGDLADQVAEAANEAGVRRSL